jgi:hypothetical protein
LKKRKINEHKIILRERLFEEFEYQNRRLEEKMRTLEGEKRAAEMAQKNLENDLQRLKQ